MNLKMNLKAILLVAVGLAALGSQFTVFPNVLAMLIGHLSFSLNMVIITSLAELAVGEMLGKEEAKPKNPLLVMLLGAIKFMGLIALLFVSIVVYELSPVFIGVGALVGLVTFLWLYAVKYLKGMVSVGSGDPS